MKFTMAKHSNHPRNKPKESPRSLEQMAAEFLAAPLKSALLSDIEAYRQEVFECAGEDDDGIKIDNNRRLLNFILWEYKPTENVEHKLVDELLESRTKVTDARESLYKWAMYAEERAALPKNLEALLGSLKALKSSHTQQKPLLQEERARHITNVARCGSVFQMLKSVIEKGAETTKQAEEDVPTSSKRAAFYEAAAKAVEDMTKGFAALAQKAGGKDIAP